MKRETGEAGNHKYAIKFVDDKGIFKTVSVSFGDGTE